jgi:hypothetical protein
MNLNLTTILRQIQGLFATPVSGSREIGVVIQDTATITWSTDGLGNITANASGVAGSLIQNTVAPGGTSTVTFSAIPQGFTNLRIIIQSSNDSGSTVPLYLTLNGDSGTNYGYAYIWNHDGGDFQHGTLGDGITWWIGNCGSPAGSGGTTETVLANYSGNTQKSCISNSGNYDNGSHGLLQLGGSYAGTSPITSMVITCAGGNFAAGSTFSLYGMQ